WFWRDGNSFVSGGLEVAVVKAEGDDDVVGLAAFLKETPGDALEAGDVFGAQGGGGAAEIVGLAPQGREPAGQGRPVRGGAGHLGDRAYGAGEDAPRLGELRR